MSWKEFFKPTKWKVILVVVISLFFVFTTFYCIPREGDYYCEISWLPALVLLYMPARILNIIPDSIWGFNLSYTIRLIKGIIVLAWSLLEFYIISCLIIFIYNKLKSKKDKKKR